MLISARRTARPITAVARSELPSALNVPEDAQWAAVFALLSFILGVSGQNAANAHVARTRGLDRTVFLTDIATVWANLDADDYPFARSIARHFPEHDDRADFVAGIDLILGGLAARRRR